jgi:excisionase family DNA binding protein
MARDGQHQQHPPLTVTVEQAAEMLGISRGTAYLAVHTGEIPSLRIGGRILVPRARLLEMLGERGAADRIDHPRKEHG